MIAAALGRAAAACARRAVLVAVLAAVLAGLGAAAGLRLAVTTEPDALFSRRLGWVQRQAALRRAFPDDEGSLVAVVDAAIPEEADVTAAQLTAALAQDPAHFRSVRNPEASPYFERNGLLFVPTGQLETLLDQTVDAQPFLGQLAADPSLAGLVGALALIGQGIQHGGVDLAPFLPAMAAFHRALAAADPAHPLSWEQLLAGPLADLGGRFRFVLAVPVLGGGAQPAAAAEAALRDAAGRLEFVRTGQAHVRVTGALALQDGQLASVGSGMLGGLLASLALIPLWLLLALRSWRIAVPVLLVLLLGLVLTTGVAAIAVGTLNLVSVAYPVLFVGLAVDFAIQFALRFREAGGQGAAIGEAGRRGGPAILVAGVATAAAFLAFTPTRFVGVAQLGLIAGAGMLIAVACTVTVLPALLVLFRAGPERGEAGFAWAGAADRFMVRRARGVLAVALLTGLLGLGLVPYLRFDGDPMHAEDQGSEAMQALADMGADPATNPYRIDVLMPSESAAEAMAARLAEVPQVGDALTLQSLVPEGQPAKLALIADAASLLDLTLDATPVAHPGAAAIRRTIVAALPDMAAAASGLPATHPYRAIVADLQGLAVAPDARLMDADAALTRFLPMQLRQLRMALGAKAVSRADIPPDVARDWVAPDGSARVQVTPAKGVESEDLGRFVRAVSAVAPGASGAAVTIVRSGAAIVAAFRGALLGALFTVAAILLIALRRVLDVALVLAPMLLTALLTVILCVALGQALTVANLIALPLLLGVGVAFNVYLVMAWRAGERGPLRSATARAMLFSALTTATAFGTLALSGHPGTASVGRLLLIGLGATVVVSLGTMPALLAACGPPGGRVRRRR